MSARRVEVAVIGAGSRGAGYAAWIAAHPGRAKVVAVAEPRPHQRRALAAAHGLDESQCFVTWQELADRPRLADAVLVCTQDRDHVEPAVALASRGYHLMVEKPLAPTEADCRRIADAVRDAGVMLAVGHVLRYTPYTSLVKELISAGAVGDVVSVQHLEPVGWWHQAHSFVRGNWRREELSTFMLLAKSCHDIDWLRYVVGEPIVSVSSFGGLTHFRPEHRPEGAAERCVDCSVEARCAYSAPRFYHNALDTTGGRWPIDVITDEPTHDGVDAALRNGPYGRCVYTSDNDVVDHQVVAMEFAGGQTATFTMTAFTEAAPRRTQIFGTAGSLDGDGTTVRHFDFLTAQATTHSVPERGGDAADGHGGGDDGLMDAFVAAVASGDRSMIRSGLDESLESHLAVFAAERARRQRTVETVTL
jgi:predicted dehydrogenase